MVADPLEGFLSPRIDDDACNDCGLCEEACPILNVPALERLMPTESYAAWNLDEEVRHRSSSGGMYSVFADHILQCEGVVFGAAFDEAFDVRHVAVHTKDELAGTRSSKYVQSHIAETYREAGALLANGRRVLFSGTPCQIAGLYGYLGADDERLLTCDLVCGGVPSPMVFEAHLAHLAAKYGSRIVSFNFRDKEGEAQWRTGYTLSISTEDGHTRQVRASDDQHMKAFSSRYIVRKACSTCPYATLPRPGDLTLADYWGLGRKVEFNHDMKEGVSLVLVNSRKGRAALDACQERSTCVKRSLAEAVEGNPRLQCPAGEHPKRTQFFADFHRLSYERLAGKYLKKRITPRRVARKLRYELGRLLRRLS